EGCAELVTLHREAAKSMDRSFTSLRFFTVFFLPRRCRTDSKSERPHAAASLQGVSRGGHGTVNFARPVCRGGSANQAGSRQANRLNLAGMVYAVPSL